MRTAAGYWEKGKKGKKSHCTLVIFRATRWGGTFTWDVLGQGHLTDLVPVGSREQNDCWKGEIKKASR